LSSWDKSNPIASKKAAPLQEKKGPALAGR